MNINGTNGLACLTKVRAHTSSRQGCLMAVSSFHAWHAADACVTQHPMHLLSWLLAALHMARSWQLPLCHLALAANLWLSVWSLLMVQATETSLQLTKPPSTD